jgi:hypothetical protein
MAAPIHDDAFAALAVMTQEFLSNPLVLDYLESAHDAVAGAEFQAMADQLLAAFQAAGIDLQLPQEFVPAEAPLAELPPLEEVAGPVHPLNMGIVEDDEDDEDDDFNPDAINCDLSTIYDDDDADPQYEEVMTGEGLPGALVNVVQDARPLLAFVRSQDIPNIIQNGFYFDLKMAIHMLVHHRSVIPEWRLRTADALANLLPHLDAEHHGLVVDLMGQVEQSMEAAENWLLQHLGPDNRLEGFPLARYYYIFYIRRHLRYPPEEDDEADGQEDGQEAEPFQEPEQLVA